MIATAFKHLLKAAMKKQKDITPADKYMPTNKIQNKFVSTKSYFEQRNK
tara:strand:- start:320 stop:466 length:147 start_codon:yes stop_codon:yes gene_type:complete